MSINSHVKYKISDYHGILLINCKTIINQTLKIADYIRDDRKGKIENGEMKERY